MKHEIKHTADGSATLYLPEMDEQYHSMNGAYTESLHVFLSMGLNYHPSTKPVVLEVGFGTGLNALLTAHDANVHQRDVYYITLEKNPLDKKLIDRLNYNEFVPENEKDLFQKIHSCAWEVPVQVTPFFRILKRNTDLTNPECLLPENCDIVYFDAFGPNKQPEIWEPEIFSRLYKSLLPGGVLVTYSAKGEIRRRLNSAGFKTERLPGPPGKKEMLRAIK